MWVLLPNPMNVFFQESDGMKKARATIAWLLSLLIFLESSIPYYFYAHACTHVRTRCMVGVQSTCRWSFIDASLEVDRHVD